MTTESEEIMARRIDVLEQRIIDTMSRTEGQRVRIERILSTVEDLLKRFEAWKVIGNEMGQNVNGVIESVEAMRELLHTHHEMWEKQSELNKAMKELAEEVRMRLTVH